MLAIVVAVLGVACLPSVNSAVAAGAPKKPQRGIVTGSIAFHGRGYSSNLGTVVQVLRRDLPVANANLRAGRPYRFELPPGTYVLIAREDGTGEILRRVVRVRSGQTTHANIQGVFH